jgi:dTDP-glucose 4,6-dehydratase
MKILVTGGAGFIGSNFVHYWLEKHPENQVVNFDLLTYAGNLENLASVEQNPNYSFIRGDIADPQAVWAATEGMDAIVNFAAETHVDRSIMDSGPFIRTNVLGTQVLLDAARKRNLRLHHVSTDEVFGSLGPNEAAWNELSPYAPRSPYSASKAAADHLVRAYFTTHNLNATISNCANNYGPYQFPEKLHGLFITNALERKPLPIYGDGLQVREWLYVKDHCAAIDAILQKGKAGNTYCVGAPAHTNLEIAKLICKLVGVDESLMTTVADRPGHDRRYALDDAKIRRELGWQPTTSFEDGMALTVEWYKQNKPWWQKIKSGEYQQYYQKQYGG